MKKFIVVLLSVSMMTMCLFGCGAKEESAATPEASEESAATSADEKDSVETMKITVSIASFDNTFASFTMSRIAERNFHDSSGDESDSGYDSC